MDILCVTETKLDECFPDSQLKDTLSGLRQFWLTESPLKMMKNGFYFTLKAFFVLKIIFWSYRKTIWLERSGYFRNLWRHKLINKQLQYTCYPISQKIKTMTVTIGQLIEYNVRNVFLHKMWCINSSQTLFSINSKLSIYLDQWSNVCL